jgi:hypothetical protein
MTRIVMLAIATAAILANTAVDAATRTPKELRGVWCNMQNGTWGNDGVVNRFIYKRCHWPAGDFDDTFEVGIREIEYNDMSDRECQLLAITSIGRGRFIVRSKCRDEASAPWKHVLERWRLLADGQQLKTNQK